MKLYRLRRTIKKRPLIAVECFVPVNWMRKQNEYFDWLGPFQAKGERLRGAPAKNLFQSGT